MDPVKSLGMRKATPPGRADAKLVRQDLEQPLRFYVRDNTKRRPAGEFESRELALSALKSMPDGHYSINNHQGDWCEVEVRGGDRFVRYALMVDGTPVAFTNIDRKG